MKSAEEIMEILEALRPDWVVSRPRGVGGVFASRGSRECCPKGRRAPGSAGRGAADADRWVSAAGRGLSAELGRQGPRRCGA